MNRAFLTLLLLIFVVAACTAGRDELNFFGVATIDTEKTICLRLRSQEKGMPLAEGYFCYAETHEAYADIAAHVGPISVGEEKVIEPFPD